MSMKSGKVGTSVFQEVQMQPIANPLALGWFGLTTGKCENPKVTAGSH